jgi:hypothetical protein
MINTMLAARTIANRVHRRQCVKVEGHDCVDPCVMFKLDPCMPRARHCAFREKKLAANSPQSYHDIPSNRLQISVPCLVFSYSRARHCASREKKRRQTLHNHFMTFRAIACRFRSLACFFLFLRFLETRPNSSAMPPAVARLCSTSGLVRGMRVPFILRRTP